MFVKKVMKIMSKLKGEYFKYYCKECNTDLIPVNHDYSPLKIKVRWQNYYCCKCDRVMFTDYGW